MADILFLLGDVAQARNDNHERLPRAFRHAGWRVTSRPHEALWIDGGVTRVGPTPVKSFELIWPLGFGRQLTFLDRMQLLKPLDDRRFVVTPDVLVYLHGKYRWLEHMPETYATSDVETLVNAVATGGDWVVKPPAGSYGRGVVKVASVSAARQAIQQISQPEDPSFCLLQRYVPEVEQGEKRSLVAGGRLIGSYLRTGQRLNNLAAGGSAAKTTLSSEESTLVMQIASALAAMGSGLAAIDIAFPYLMEVNVANPGGLGTLETLYGVDLTNTAVQSILSWKGFDQQHPTPAS